MTELLRKAHSVLFPVTVDLQPNADILRFLDHGGRSVLFGETGEEYVAGKINPSRKMEETIENWQKTTEALIRRAGPLLLSCDADVSAVHRLEYVTPALPTFAEAQNMPSEAFEEAIYKVALSISKTGMNLLLSPTADVVVGHNPWLKGRTLGNDIATVSRFVSAYVKGIKRAKLASTLKHFPGHPELTGIPAIEIAKVPHSMAQLRPFLEPFIAGVRAGADAVMLSPAIFDAVTPPIAGSLSADIVTILRDEIGFKGLIMTCDLDHRSTIRENTLNETVIAALNAGSDLLLLSPRSVSSIPMIAAAIVGAVEKGSLAQERLEQAASSVEALISKNLN